MMVAWGIAKALFGSVFGFIFKDWRITLLVVILALCGYGYYKYDKVQDNLAETQKVLKVEQENNQVLRNNLAIAAQTNAANEKILQQVQSDNTLTRKQVAQLNNMLHARNTQIADLKGQLMSQPGQAVTPNIAWTVDAIQRLREESRAGK